MITNDFRTSNPKFYWLKIDSLSYFILYIYIYFLLQVTFQPQDFRSHLECDTPTTKVS